MELFRRTLVQIGSWVTPKLFTKELSDCRIILIVDDVPANTRAAQDITPLLWSGNMTNTMGPKILSKPRLDEVRWAQPQPAVTMRVWPSGWVCQAVPAPGSNVTLAAETPQKCFNGDAPGKRVACGKSRKNWKTISAAGGGRRRSLILCLRQC